MDEELKKTIEDEIDENFDFFINIASINGMVNERIGGNLFVIIHALSACLAHAVINAAESNREDLRRISVEAVNIFSKNYLTKIQEALGEESR